MLVLDHASLNRLTFSRNVDKNFMMNFMFGVTLITSHYDICLVFKSNFLFVYESSDSEKTQSLESDDMFKNIVCSFDNNLKNSLY